MRGFRYLLALLSTGALSFSGCSAGPAPEAAAVGGETVGVEAASDEPMRGEIKATLARYYEALETEDLSLVSFTPDVVLGLTTGTAVEGEEDVRAFLENTARRVEDIHVRQTVIEGEYACSMTDYRWTGDAITPLAICFRVVDGRIAEIRPYFDPRPIL